jgi:hypothetical protein
VDIPIFSNQEHHIMFFTYLHKENQHYSKVMNLQTKQKYLLQFHFKYGKILEH